MKELASAVGKSEKVVVRDLQRLIENRAFTNGHLDIQNTCLMLDDTTYRQYLATQEAYRQRRLEEQARQSADKNAFFHQKALRIRISSGLLKRAIAISKPSEEPMMRYREKRYPRSYTDWKH